MSCRFSAGVVGGTCASDGDGSSAHLSLRSQLPAGISGVSGTLAPSTHLLSTIDLPSTHPFFFYHSKGLFTLHVLGPWLSFTLAYAVFTQACVNPGLTETQRSLFGVEYSN